MKSHEEDLLELHVELERVMGPVRVAVTTIELFNNDAPDVEFDPILLGQQILKSVQLVYHAFNKLNHLSMLRTLRSLVDIKEAQ